MRPKLLFSYITVNNNRFQPGVILGESDALALSHFLACVGGSYFYEKYENMKEK